MKIALLAAFLFANLWAQTAPRLPDWLQPLPEARDVVVHNGRQSIQTTYETAMAPAAVVSSYQKRLQSAGMQPKADFDGIGTSIRVSTHGVSGVISVRESDTGTHVKVEFAVVGIVIPPNTGFNGTCPEGKHLYTSSGKGVCSEAAPLKLEWPEWLDSPRFRLISAKQESPRAAGLWGWFDEPTLVRQFESAEKSEDLYAYYRELFRMRGYTVSGQLTPTESWVRGFQRPVKYAALDPKHVLPEYSNVQYVRQIHIRLARADGPTPGTHVTVLLQVRN
jgi:hypothetical protein